ncbi:MAG: DNA repair protein RecO [Chloroflexi bacterium]|nr:DNA repair protein RecO [Chloroflexota bacterium]
MRQERLYRTEGIVLREMDYGEADRILTILTPTGRISALAKGIRRATSRKAGHLGLFVRANLLMARGRNLDIVTQAESLEEFEGLHQDLLRFTYACYAAELVDCLAQEEEGSAELYRLLLDGLRCFSTESDLRLWMRYFELRLLRYAGFQPELFTCLGCGQEIRPQRNYFSAVEGGFLCARCGERAPTARQVSLNAQKVLRFLQTRDAEAVGRLRLTESTHAEVEAILQGYLEYVLEREVRSAAFLRRLRAELRAGKGQQVENDEPNL